MMSLKSKSANSFCDRELGILISGGLDSASLAYHHRPSFAYFIDYGQQSLQAELKAVEYLCEKLGMKLRKEKIRITEYKAKSELGGFVFPTDFLPLRNQLLLTVACIKALSDGVKKLIVGSIISDSEYPDSSPEFFEKINELHSVQKMGIQVIAPGSGLTKSQLVQFSKIPLAMIAKTHSCNFSDPPCGICNSCVDRNSILSEFLHERKKLR